jgi:hypothetical protein
VRAVAASAYTCDATPIVVPTLHIMTTTLRPPKQPQFRDELGACATPLQFSLILRGPKNGEVRIRWIIGVRGCMVRNVWRTLRGSVCVRRACRVDYLLGD